MKAKRQRESSLNSVTMLDGTGGHVIVTTPRSRWANSNFVQASIVMPIISPAYLWRGEIQGCAIALCRIGDIGAQRKHRIRHHFCRRQDDNLHFVADLAALLPAGARF